MVVDGEARDGDRSGKHELQVDIPLPHKVGDLLRIDIVRAMLVVLSEKRGEVSQIEKDLMHQRRV